MDKSEDVKAADWVTDEWIGSRGGKPLGGRNEALGPDAETPSELKDHRGAEPMAYGPGAETHGGSSGAGRKLSGTCSVSAPTTTWTAARMTCASSRVSYGAVRPTGSLRTHIFYASVALINSTLRDPDVANSLAILQERSTRTGEWCPQTRSSITSITA